MDIRIGYYLQWYSSIFAAWIAPSEVPNLRFAMVFFSAATFLALVIQVVRSNLDAVEVYIILLLTFGAAVNILIIVVWRIATGFNERWDPTRWPRAKAPGRTFNLLYTLFLIAVVVFQIWFWSVQISKLNGSNCIQFGFLFSKIRLNANWFRGFRLALFSLLLLSLIILRTRDSDGKLKSISS